MIFQSEFFMALTKGMDNSHYFCLVGFQLSLIIVCILLDKPQLYGKSFLFSVNKVELQWHEQLWSHENMYETGVVRANEC